MGASFETYLRRPGDLLMRRRHYVPLRRGHDMPIRCLEDVPLRRLDEVLIETSLGVSFETYLRRRWDLQRDDVPTSSRPLVAGWVIWGSYCFNLEMKSNNKCSNYDTNEEILNGKFVVKAPPLLLINTARSSFDRSGKVLKLQLVYHYYSISVNILLAIMVFRPKYPLKF